jgi:hypothetical protein
VEPPRHTPTTAITASVTTALQVCRMYVCSSVSGTRTGGEIGYRGGPYRWSVTALYNLAAAWSKAAV